MIESKYCRRGQCVGCVGRWRPGHCYTLTTVLSPGQLDQAGPPNYRVLHTPPAPPRPARPPRPRREWQEWLTGWAGGGEVCLCGRWWWCGVAEVGWEGWVEESCAEDRVVAAVTSLPSHSQSSVVWSHAQAALHSQAAQTSETTVNLHHNATNLTSYNVCCPGR